MQTFGQILKQAREAKGLTPSQVAAKTHLLVQVVEDLEKETFERVPAPIYGRGFVRLYAECMELDPVPLVADFMAAFTGKRPRVSEPRVDTPAPVPKASAGESPRVAAPVENASAESAPAVAPVAAESLAPAVSPEVPPIVRGLDLFDEQARKSAPLPPPDASPYVTSASYGPEAAAEKVSAAERFRDGLSSVSHGVLGQAQRIPKSVWRIAMMSVLLLVVLGLIVWGCVALYHITEEGAREERVEEAPPLADAEKADVKKADAKKVETKKPAKLHSSGQKIPQLYLD